MLAVKSAPARRITGFRSGVGLPEGSPRLSESRRCDGEFGLVFEGPAGKLAEQGLVPGREAAEVGDAVIKRDMSDRGVIAA